MNDVCSGKIKAGLPAFEIFFYGIFSLKFCKIFHLFGHSVVCCLSGWVRQLKIFCLEFPAVCFHYEDNL